MLKYKRGMLLLQMNANDLKDNLKKLNSSMSFLIKHSQKLFRVSPLYFNKCIIYAIILYCLKMFITPCKIFLVRLLVISGITPSSISVGPMYCKAR